MKETMPKCLAVITVVTLAVFLFFPQLDLATSAAFFENGKFIYRENPFVKVVYFSVRVITGGVLAISLYVIFYDWLHDKIKFLPESLVKLGAKIRSFIKFTRKQILFVFLVIVITPGILVHWVVKPVWERARPVNVEEFGGAYQFSPFWNLNAGQDGKSFPSGHASMAFSLVAFSYIVSAKNRKMVLVAAYTYAFISSFFRIVQGGHFLSDVTISAVITLWTVWLLKKFYLEKHTSV